MSPLPLCPSRRLFTTRRPLLTRLLVFLKSLR